MSTQDAALRVTVLDALSAAADAELAKARDDAAGTFKAAIEATGFGTARGAIQVEARLPDGTVLGHLSVKAGVKATETDETGLHEWVAERNPEALEPYAVPHAATDDGVLAMLLDKCPDLVGLHLKPGALEDPRALGLLASEYPHLLSSRVRPATLKAYVKEAAKVEPGSPKGWLVDPATGERLQLATETQNPPSGAFAFVGAETQERRRLVMEALAAGDPAVRAIAFGAVGALSPAPEGGDRDD